MKSLAWNKERYRKANEYESGREANQGVLDEKKTRDKANPEPTVRDQPIQHSR